MNLKLKPGRTKRSTSPLSASAFSDTPIYREMIVSSGFPIPFDRFETGARQIAAISHNEPKQLTS